MITRIQQINRIYKGVIYALLILILLPGCGILSRNSGQQLSQNPEQSEKTPKELEEIEQIIENIFVTLGGPSPGQNISSQQQTQGETEQQSSGSSSGDKHQDNEQEQSESEPDPWTPVIPQIENLHLYWNESLPQVTKKAVKKELIDHFSDDLNVLTKLSDTKDKNKTLLAANALYGNLPDLFSLFKDNNSPELKRGVYYARNIVLLAMVGDWPTASLNTEELKSLWSVVKNSVSKDQQDNATKLDLSIYELEKVVKEKNNHLVEIKGKLTLDNIDALQQSMEKGEA